MDNNNSDLSKDISTQINREKSLRRGAIHLWWAKETSTLSRVATYIALTGKQPVDLEFIETTEVKHTITTWEWTKQSNQQEAKPEKSTSSDNLIPPIRVLDPFAGSGTIPLEAAKLGCESYASELSPVAFHILRATLEFPPKWIHSDLTLGSANKGIWGGLIEEVHYWTERMEEYACVALSQLFPNYKAAADSIYGYLWFNTVHCTNSSCHAHIPIHSFPFLLKDEREQSTIVQFEIIDEHLQPKLSKDDKASINLKRGREIVCPYCGNKIDRKLNRIDLTNSSPILGVIIRKGAGDTRFSPVSFDEIRQYIPWSERNESDLNRLLSCDFAQQLKTKLAKPTWQMVINKGIRSYYDLFTSRQKLVALKYMEAIKLTQEDMRRAGMESERIEAISTYLAFFLDYCIERNNILSRWNSRRCLSEFIFSRGIPVTTDVFVELNPIGLFRAWLKQITPAIESASTATIPANVQQADSSNLPYDNNFFDAIVTNPPLPNTIDYDGLAEFYWVWEQGLLQRSDLTSEKYFMEQPIKFREEEIKEQFWEKLSLSFSEIYRILREGKYFSIIFSHHSKEHIEKLIEISQKNGFELFDLKTVATSYYFSSNVHANTSILLIIFKKPGDKTEQYSLKRGQSIESPNLIIARQYIGLMHPEDLHELCQTTDKNNIEAVLGLIQKIGIPNFVIEANKLINKRENDFEHKINREIKAGESKNREFKSTLRWNIKAEKIDHETITYAVLKTIAAFLNTDGGTLLIGVADNGSIVGIELDRFENNDKFLLFLKDKIKRALEIYTLTFVDFEISSINEKSVCVVKCQKSSRPVYLQSKGGIDEFYVRMGPSSEKLPIRDISKYINERFHP